MFKTKKELDLHVEDTFSKVRGEHEKSLRCFTIAKQYASIKEFNAAIRYMEKYLTTSPSNTAEALKLIGEYYQESNRLDKALEFYKSSYNTRKTRESLTKICDLIEAGYGSREDQGMGRQKWFDLQKVAPNLPNAPLPYYHDSSPASFSNRQAPNGGPPRTGFSKTLVTTSNISNSPKSSTRVNGVSSHEVSFSLSPTKVYASPDREETQIRNLERRYDDTLAKILSTVQRIEDDVNLLKEKVENITLLQEEYIIESPAQSKKADETKSNAVTGNGNRENENNVPPIAQPQQLPPLMQPNPAFGYGVPFPSPYMHPFFMPDPTLSYLNNPMLAAAAFYGNPLFGNPLAAGGVPRNETQQPPVIPPNSSETSLLAGLLTKNQFMPQPDASSQVGDGLYPQNQLIQAQLASSANLTDKLWQAPQVVPTSLALRSMFSTTGVSTSNTNPNGIMNSLENSKNSPVTSTPVKTPTNSIVAKAEISETPKSSSSTIPAAKKEAKGTNLFPENVVVSNTEKVPTVSSSAFNSNVLSVTIPPEHRNAGTSHNNTNTSTLAAFNTSMNMSENKSISQIHNFQISAPVFKPQEPKFDDKKAQDEAANPFSNISLTAPSFGDLAKSAASSGFTGFQSVNAFNGTGTPVFGNVIASQSAAGESVVRQERADGEEATEDFVPTAEFQPVIPLPPLVEVKKGNENENTLFEHRAKIYRFVKETKEWKERGVGNIMILQDKDNTRKIRVVMWRERVFKLACNHWITKDLVIENHQGSPKILKWTVLDFAEGDSDPKLEIFTCRFAQEDKCAEFKATMERMVTSLASLKEDSSPEQKPQEVEVSIRPFAELFKKPAGSWECKTCYVNNAEKDISCLSCGTSSSNETAANPFSSISLAAPSFSDLAKSAASSGFTGFQSVNAFSGTGAPVFGNMIASQSAAGVVGEDRPDGDEATDDFVPTAEFQPVIPLPPLVEVKKGNENENTLFEQRAKIYRFVKETKEWKERGVGNIMILQDKDNPRKIRVVMWRERVFKLACNHWITKDLVIENHQGSPKILKWTVMDFAEGDSDPKLEIFTCRFAQEDKCAEFKATMERMVTFLASVKEDSSPEQKPQEVEVSIRPFAELFKKPAGSWECKACYVNNGEKDISCLSCGTSKEGANDNPFSSISFTAPSFGDLAKSAASSGFTGFQSVNAFNGTGAPVFGFGNVFASLSAESAAGESGVRQERADGEEATEDFVPTAEFQPVIPLPPLVEVKKGNENENTLFEHRAKIYRFVKETKEWKERGVGNIMILQDKDNTRKIRIVMWRERVFKLACNHWITKDLVIENHQGSPKILKWTVLDFAEGDSDPKLEIFTCRFAQEDKCAEFKATVERMVTSLASLKEDSSPEQKPQEVEVSIRPFAELFKKPAGGWECKTCYVSNVEKDISCASCGTPNETKSLAELFKAPEGSWSCATCDVKNGKDVTKCVACNTMKPGCQPEVVSFKPDTVPFTFGFGALKNNVVNNTPSAEDCPGCRGCDPDSFDFSQLDKRTFPLPPKEPIQKITKTLKIADEQISSTSN